MADSDFKRLATMVDIVLTSEHQGEIDSAIRQARRLAKESKLRAADLVEAVEQRFKILDAAKGLSDEVDRLRVENERLKKSANGGGTLAQALWQDTNMPQTVSNRSAQWALDLAGQGAVYLMEKETDFLSSCARRRVLTPRQQDWLKDIVAMVTRRTGQMPPP
jgi:hypothetical protein